MQKGEYRLDLRPVCFRGVRPRILADERGRFAREPRSGVEFSPECQTIENRDAMAAAIVRSATYGERDPVQPVQGLKTITPEATCGAEQLEVHQVRATSLFRAKLCSA
jgi:hypothetical protein